MKKTMKLAIVFAALAALGLAQDKPADPPKGPVAKDEAEAKLINTVNAEPDAAKRLSELEEWKQKYPDTQFEDPREMFFLLTDEQLKKNREAFDQAKEIRAKHPENYSALLALVLFGPTMNNNNPSKEDFDATIEAANYMLENADKVFADSSRPPTVTAADWPKVRPYWMAHLPEVEAQMWVNTKKYPEAEAELGKVLQAHPNDGMIDQLMGQVILAEKIPEKQGVALFYYARAACYDGEGALPAANRKTMQTGFLARAYKTYHGSDEGFQTLCDTAKANPAPPADFKVLSVAEIAKVQADKEAADAAANPSMALFKKVKEGLTGDGDSAFFDSVKGAGLPSTDGTMKWKGKLVSMTPAIRPKTLVLAVGDPAGDVTLNFEMPLPGKMDVGSELEFWGVADSYTKSPYMLTMKVDKENLTGWKPVPVGNKKSTTKKSQ
jgi:hypothetical protein